MTKDRSFFRTSTFLTPAHFRPIIAALKSDAFDSTAVSLLSIGYDSSRSPIDPHADVNEIKNQVRQLVSNHSRDVVLVGDSSGGLVVSRAVKGLEKKHRQSEGLPGGVILIFFINAFLLLDGISALQTIGNASPPCITRSQ